MKKTGWQTEALLLFFIVGHCGRNATLAVYRAKVPAIFSFGDCLLDVGTNNFILGSSFLSDFLSDGETFLLKGPGRCTNGRLEFALFASDHGLPFIPPFLQPGETFEQAVNFRSAGSGVHSTTGLGDGVNPLTALGSQFQQVVAKLANGSGMAATRAAAGDLISNSVFFLVPRSNDRSAFKNSPLRRIVSSTEFVTNVLSHLQAHAETVYSAPVRKVVYLGIARLGCSPESMAAANATNRDCEAASNKVVEADNGAFLQLVDGLHLQLRDLHAMLANRFDTI